MVLMNGLECVDLYWKVLLVDKCLGGFEYQPLLRFGELLMVLLPSFSQRFIETTYSVQFDSLNKIEMGLKFKKDFFQ